MEIRLRSTYLDTYKVCPMKFYLEQGLPKEDWGNQSLALGFGSAIHKYLEEYVEHKNHDLAMGIGLIEYPFYKAPTASGGKKSIEQYYVACEKLRTHPIINSELVKIGEKKLIEYSFRVNLITGFENTYYLSGMFDGVYNLNGKPVAVDYKTSEKEANEDVRTWLNRLQFKLYTYILKQMFPQDYPISLKVISVYTTKEDVDIVELDIPFDEVHHTELLASLSYKILFFEMQHKLNFFLREDNCLVYNSYCRYHEECMKFKTASETLANLKLSRVVPTTDEEEKYDITLEMDLRPYIDTIKNTLTSENKNG